MLKTNSFAFGGKFDRNNERPRPVGDSVTAWTGVMPVQPIADVTGDPDIVARGVGVTSNDVDDPFFNAVHACS